jgi:hypothetical protein
VKLRPVEADHGHRQLLDAAIKLNLWGNDGGDTALAVLPFMRFPTAQSGLGNGDAGLTFGIHPDLQLDGGTRWGLTEAADDLGIFVGVSLRL